MENDSENSPSSAHLKGNLRPWKKGKSGNPNGRPPKGYATAEKLRAALVEEIPAILERLVRAAKAGDIAAAKTILERVLPPLRAIEVPAMLDMLTGTLSEQGQAILLAMSQGLLAPGQATQLLGAIASQAKILEVEDLAKRLGELERRIGNAK